MEIQDFPNYLIYPDGRVFSKNYNHSGKGQFLKSGDINGYRMFILFNDEGKKQMYVHRLVGIHYIPNPDNKPTIDHINRIRDDNRVENLRWATRSEQNSNLIRNDKTIPFRFICKRNTRKTSFIFSRKDCKIKESKSLPKLICYSFFYLLKHPLP